MFIERFEIPENIQKLIFELIYLNRDNFSNIESNDDSFEKFDKIPIPKLSTAYDINSTLRGNIERKKFNFQINDNARIEEIKNFICADECTNALMYPKNTIMHWHTNADLIGTRAYIIYTKEPGIFRYQNPKTKEIVDDYDNVGFTGRLFPVGKTKEDLLWHTVWSPGKRFSFGFNFGEVSDNN